MQGFLAREKTHPPETLPEAWGPRVLGSHRDPRGVGIFSRVRYPCTPPENGSGAFSVRAKTDWRVRGRQSVKREAGGFSKGSESGEAED